MKVLKGAIALPVGEIREVINFLENHLAICAKAALIPPLTEEQVEALWTPELEALADRAWDGWDEALTTEQLMERAAPLSGLQTPRIRTSIGVTRNGHRACQNVRGRRVNATAVPNGPIGQTHSPSRLGRA